MRASGHCVLSVCRCACMPTPNKMDDAARQGEKRIRKGRGGWNVRGEWDGQQSWQEGAGARDRVDWRLLEGIVGGWRCVGRHKESRNSMYVVGRGTNVELKSDKECRSNGNRGGKAPRGPGPRPKGPQIQPFSPDRLPGQGHHGGRGTPQGRAIANRSPTGPKDPRAPGPQPPRHGPPARALPPRVPPVGGHGNRRLQELRAEPQPSQGATGYFAGQAGGGSCTA